MIAHTDKWMNGLPRGSCIGRALVDGTFAVAGHRRAEVTLAHPSQWCGYWSALALTNSLCAVYCIIVKTRSDFHQSTTSMFLIVDLRSLGQQVLPRSPKRTVWPYSTSEKRKVSFWPCSWRRPSFRWGDGTARYGGKWIRADACVAIHLTDADIQGSSTSPTRLARGLLATQVVLSVLAILPPSRPVVTRHLGLVPYRALTRLRLWSLFTSALFDTRPLAAVLSVAATAVAARPAQLAMGARGLIYLLLFATGVAAATVSVFALLIYAATRFGGAIFTPIATASGFNLALLIALKQHIPDHEVGFGSARMRLSLAPFAFACTSVVLSLLGQLSLPSLMLGLITGNLAWAWLRFARRSPLSGERGDSSEGFAFATLFPPPMRPAMTVVGNMTFIVFRPIINLANETVANANGPKQELVNSIVQDRGNPIDAERRRQRAQKALDERIAGSTSEPAIWLASATRWVYCGEGLVSAHVESDDALNVTVPCVALVGRVS